MPISIPDLFSIPLMYWMDMALDGKTMLYSSNATGIPHLYVSETKPRSRPKQITSGNDPVVIASLSPAGDRVVYLQDKDGNELHHLFMVSARGGKPRQITRDPHRTWDVRWQPKGKEVARSYSAKDLACLEICNLKTEECFTLKEQKTPFFIADYSHDGKWVACTEYGGGKDPKNMQVIVINRNDPTDTINYKFKEGSKEFYPSWSHDDKKLAFLSNVKGKNQVVIQDFKGTKRLFLPLKEGEEAADAQGPCWASTSDKVYYAVVKQSRTRIYEHPLNKEKTALPFPEGTILVYRVSRDGKTIIALRSALSSPHTIYLNKIGSKTVEPLTSQKYKVNLAKLAKPRSVWHKSFDGLKIHSWYLPAGYGKAPYPAVVWPHGGPWWQTYDKWDPYLQSISQSGFAVLAPNFRGSTGYGAEFRNMDLSDPGGGDLEDVVSGAKWLAKQPDIDKSKIAIMGGSYGGFMTLIALTRKPEVFAAGAAIAPVADWQEMYELSDTEFRKFMEELFEGTPEKKGKLYRDRSPITHISQIKAPVLVNCGRNDSRCPMQPVEKFVKKLEKMGHPHTFEVEEKEGHGAIRVEAIIKEITTAVEYLKKTMKIK
jgi:dipeptidyl aminopeptidase/acylaminoacyl peptidase